MNGRLLDQLVIFLIASLFIMGTSLKGKNAPTGSEIFPLNERNFGMDHFNTLGALP